MFSGLVVLLSWGSGRVRAFTSNLILDPFLRTHTRGVGSFGPSEGWFLPSSAFFPEGPTSPIAGLFEVDEPRLLRCLREPLRPG